MKKEVLCHNYIKVQNQRWSKNRKNLNLSRIARETSLFNHYIFAYVIVNWMIELFDRQVFI